MSAPTAKETGMNRDRTCSTDGCTRPVRCKGFCSAHYRTWRKYGTPISPHRKTEAERFWEKVDRRGPDDCWLWTAGKRGDYGLFNVPPTTVRSHRYAYIETHGPVPDGLVLDHKCRVPLCVNPRHIQAVTVSQNNQNHSGPTRSSSSGVRGVWWCKTWRRWVGQASAGGKFYSIGHHETLESAAVAIRDLRNRIHDNNLIDREVAP